MNKTFLSLIIASVTLAACDYHDLGSASLRLQQGMTEAEAIAAIGSPPNRANVTPCGKKSELTCRILIYDGTDAHQLIVYEAAEASVHGVWRVISWNTM
jgi:hypothetical protein